MRTKEQTNEQQAINLGFVILVFIVIIGTILG
jgi:hypothetical protein